MTTKTSAKLDHIRRAEIAEAQEERAGRYYDDDEVEAWLDQLETNPNTQLPPLKPEPPR